jgi:Zn-dependent protease
LYDVSIATLLGRVIGVIIGFSLHEFAHAWTAYRLGDNTAYHQGRLTVDPRSHIEPMGLILALIAGFGWARPVPVNPRAFYPDETRGLLVVSLAGPVMNLIIAVVVGILLRVMLSVVPDANFLLNVVETVVWFNLVLFLFNLIPLAPLDGFKIAVGMLPREQSYSLMRYERETTVALMLLILVGAMSQGRLNVLGTVLGPPLRFLYNLIVG